MTKTQICIAIDTEVAEKFKKMFPRDISAYCNEQMKRKIELATNDVSNINLVLMTSELEEVSKKVDHYSNSQQELISKIRLVKEEIANKDHQDLLKEKERIESTKKCTLCGMTIENPSRIVQLTDKVIICKTCYDPTNNKFIELQKQLKEK
jgi:lysyl-tRNA synthetase class I